MCNTRIYVFGINQEGCREFLHTFLDNRGASDYCEKHKKLFGNRFDQYIFGTALELFSPQEINYE